MTIAVRFGRGSATDKPLLVLGPSLGTSAGTLWAPAAELLTEHFTILAFELPGHGLDRSRPTAPLTMGELAAGVLEMVDEVGAEHFYYAGDSVGGAIGIQLLLDAPERVLGAALLCTGARIGTPEGWQERIETVRSGGTASLVEASSQRWFGPGFVEREPDRAAALLTALAEATDEGYAAVCGALADFDERARLAEVRAPVLALAGSHDEATPPDLLRLLADGVPTGTFWVLDGVGHLAPAEAPADVARLLAKQLLGVGRGPRPDEERTHEAFHAGERVRREVLGDAHVDRAQAATTPLTADFQDFITTYAWGGVWARDGLDRRSRSMITITAMVALGHTEELALHVRAARTNGLTDDEIAEVILHSAVYCGVPAANKAFAVAQRVLDELDS